MVLPSYIQFAMVVFVSLMITNISVIYVESFAGKQVLLGLSIPILVLFAIIHQRGMVGTPLEELSSLLRRLLSQHTSLVRSMNDQADNVVTGNDGSGGTFGHSNSKSLSGVFSGTFEPGSEGKMISNTKKLQETLLDNMRVPMYESDLFEVQKKINDLAHKYVTAQHKRLEDRLFPIQTSQSMTVNREELTGSKREEGSFANTSPLQNSQQLPVRGYAGVDVDNTPYGTTGEDHVEPVARYSGTAERPAWRLDSPFGASPKEQPDIDIKRSIQQRYEEVESGESEQCNTSSREMSAVGPRLREKTAEPSPMLQSPNDQQPHGEFFTGESSLRPTPREVTTAYMDEEAATAPSSLAGTFSNIPTYDSDPSSAGDASAGVTPRAGDEHSWATVQTTKTSTRRVQQNTRMNGHLHGVGGAPPTARARR